MEGKFLEIRILEFGLQFAESLEKADTVGGLNRHLLIQRILYALFVLAIQ